MLKDLLNNHIQFAESAATWADAIKLAAEPLLADGSIEPGYVAAMIKNVETNGSYIVIIPNLAIPHALPENGVNITAISLLKLRQPVMFPENKPVQVIMALAPYDPDVHLELMSELTDLLMEEDRLEKLYAAANEIQLKELL